MKIGRVLFLCMTLASVAPLWAEESGSSAAISAAFSNKNYNKGLELVGQAFARLQPSQSVEAATLIKSVLASVPIDESGATVVAAIYGNPSLGTAILNAAVSGAGRDEQLTILSRVSFAVSQHPEESGSLAEHLPGMLSNAERTVPVSVALTAPTYNPANSPSDTKERISNPDIQEDKKDIKQDLAELKAEKEVLQDLRQLHAPKKEIQQELRDIRSVRKDLNSDKTDLKRDPRFFRQEDKGKDRPSDP
jgi:hypothetical protein